MRARSSIKKLERACAEASRILKALSHPRRLLIMGHLLQGPKTVGELVSLCETMQPQMSHFLTRMKIEGLLTAERQGRFIVYSVSDRRLIRLMKSIQAEYCKD